MQGFRQPSDQEQSVLVAHVITATALAMGTVRAHCLSCCKDFRLSNKGPLQQEVDDEYYLGLGRPRSRAEFLACLMLHQCCSIYTPEALRSRVHQIRLASFNTWRPRRSRYRGTAREESDADNSAQNLTADHKNTFVRRASMGCQTIKLIEGRD